MKRTFFLASTKPGNDFPNPFSASESHHDGGDDMLSIMRKAIGQGRFAVSLHAEQRLKERGISLQQIRSIMMSETTEIIEVDHRSGRPYPTVLILGWGEW